MQYIRFPVLFFLLVCSAIPLVREIQARETNQEQAQAILEKIDDLWRSTSSTAELKMIVQTENYTRTMIMESWTKGREKSLVRITSPLKERGTVSLKNDKTMYTYLPKTDRVIRLTSGMMMGSWMGSHFTNDDLIKESRLSEDYIPEITFAGERDGSAVIEFDLIPKPEAPVVWGKIAITVRADDYLPVVSRYYDEDLTLARTLEFTDIREMGGRLLPAVLHMTPADKPGEYTELIYLQIEFDVDVSDSLFSIMQLRRMGT
ncbi:MAG: outer membrane lipoprotein-sorting protein [Desulfobulbaceae bacterium]|nr:outer membrane lipoprotein-sorting protein [Desulfobulbaceae bacterium]